MHRQDFSIELIDQRRHGHGRAVAAGFFDREAQILAHPFGGETKVEALFAHRLPAVEHQPAGRRPARNHLEHFFEIEPHMLGKVQRLGDRLVRDGQRDLVDHLGLLARARPADVDDALGIRLHQRRGGGNRLFRSAAHDRQRSIARADFGPGDRRIDHQNAAILALCRELPREPCRHRTVIDEQRAFLHGTETSFRPHRHRFQVAISGNTGKNRIGSVRGGSRSRRVAPAMFSDPFFGADGGAIVHGDVMADPRKVSSDRPAHRSQPDKGNLSHYRQA